MSSYKLIAFAAVLFSACSLCDAAAPATQPDYSVSPMRVQRLAGATYFYTEKTTTLAQIHGTVDKAIPALMKSITDNHIQVVGPVVLDYQGISPNPQLPFELRIGVIVSADTQPAGDFRVDQLAPIKAASVIYTGPLQNLKAGYDAVFRSLFAAHYLPTGETREYYLYWEGPDSVNNVIMIQAGI